ncbi:MAG: DUF4870 domain-containing protein [Planctomycetes bacterium]|nr:DUF4870 domain-containing protein [Planctomycetota bacterium]
MTGPVPAPSAEVSKDARTWGMLCHLTALSGFVGLPFGHILGPLICWLIKKNDHEFVDDQGKEALNFQITLTIAAIVCIPLVFLIIGIFMLIAVAVLGVVFSIIGAIKANEGVRYRYPFALRLIS